MTGLLERLRAAPSPAGEAPTLYLHIGMNKTGTTAIQHTLATHESVLRANGLLYPKTGRGRTHKHYLFSNALGFTLRKRKPGHEKAGLDELASALHREVARAGCRSIVLSSEAFMHQGDIARVREYLAEWNPRIVVYLRRHDHWWASSYSQGLRHMAPPPWPRGFEGYMQRQQRRSTKGDYRLLVDGWAGVFGVDGVIVRPYERAQNQPDIVADLLAAIGRGELAALLGASTLTRNASPGPRELALIEEVQRTEMDPRLRRRVVRSIGERAGGKRDESLMSPRLRYELIAENLEDYEYIARTFLKRADGLLFHEPLPEPSAPWKAPEAVSPHEIEQAIAAGSRTSCALCRATSWLKRRPAAPVPRCPLCRFNRWRRKRTLVPG